MVKTKINSDQFAKRLDAYSHEVSKLVKPGCLVEIEVIAVKQK